MHKPAHGTAGHRQGFVSLAFLFLAIAYLSPVEIATPQAQAAFNVSTFVNGLTEPTAMAFAPDGRLFVAEKWGHLRVVAADGTLRGTSFLDLSVTRSGERGLLGVTFDPAFTSNGYVYVYYTTAQGHNRVSRFTADPTAPDRARAESEAIILDNIPGESTHDGGSLHFGRDGYLYVAVGDARAPTNAQSLGSLSGKLLRLDPASYPNVIPAGNPFANVPTARKEIWAYGLRNPFTFAFDRNDRLFINDVGGGYWEEINRGLAGANYGWPTCEGPANSGVGNCTSSAFSYPVSTYGHSVGTAITGGVFYEGSQFPSEYRDSYFYGDYGGNWIRRLTPTNQVMTFLTNARTPIDLDVGPDGSLYYLSYGDGAVYRVRYESGNRTPTAVFSANPPAGPPPLTVNFDASASNDPDNDALTYTWAFGDGATATGMIATHTYTTQGTRVVTLSVSDGRGGTATASQNIAVGAPPAASIIAPAAGTLYAAGDAVRFEGTANDPETGSLPPSSFSWTVTFHHDTHAHPFLGPVNGVTYGTFTVPDIGETASNVWYRITLTATDPSGLTSTTYRDVLPRLSQVTLQTNPAGIEITLDGQPVATPFGFTGVVGMRRRVEAPAGATADGQQYAFTSWTDNGARVHDIVTPSVNTTYMAQYTTSTGGTAASQTFLRFDGVDDHVAVSGASALGQGSAMTVTAWVRPAANDLRMYIVAKGTSGDEHWTLERVGSNNKVVFGVRNQAGTRASSASATAYAADLEWHHVAGVYDGAGVSVYVDGTLSGTPAELSGTIRTGANLICVGLRQSGSGCGTYGPTRGDIDHVTLWNRALTPAEIQGIMGRTLPSNTSSLAAVWEFDDGSGQLAMDSGPNAAHGQLGLSSSPESADPAWIADQGALAVALTDPTSDAVLIGALTLRASVSGGAGAPSVRFHINGNAIGQDDPTAPYEYVWNTAEYPNGPYALTAVARDGQGNTVTSTPVSVTVNNPPPADTTPPDVSITQPAHGTTISGTVAVSANATDATGVAGVQFRLDGSPLGSEVTAAPYAITWLTTGSSNGTHTLTAIARDASGNSTSSPAITITLDNRAPAISSLRVSSIATTWAQVEWLTDVSATGQVEYGEALSYGATTSWSSYTTSHGHTLLGLQPATTYHLRVRATSASGITATSQDVTFTTQPAQDASRPGARFLRFDGIDDRVSVPASTEIGEGTAITVSAWIRPSVNDVSMWIVTKGRASAKQWTLHRIKSNNRVGFLVSNSSGTIASATSGEAVAADFAWHHVAGVYDGQQVYLYVDGDRSASTSAALQGPILDSDQSICIGALDPGSAADCGDGSGFQGDIDDVRIYNRALTEDEIRSTMAVELQGTEPGLSVYWMFNEGEGQLALDSSAASIHARIGDTASPESTDPIWILETTGQETPTSPRASAPDAAAALVAVIARATAGSHDRTFRRVPRATARRRLHDGTEPATNG